MEQTLRQSSNRVESVQNRSFFWSKYTNIRTRKKLSIWTLFTQYRLPRDWTNFHISPSQTNKHICTSVSSPRVWLTTRPIKKSFVIEASMYRLLSKILQIKTHYIKSLTSEAKCAKGDFRLQYPVWGFNFTTYENSEKLTSKINTSTILLTGQAFILVYITSWLANMLIFTVSRLWKNVFLKLPRPCLDLIINPPLRAVPQ